MKRYTKFDRHTLLIGIIIPILTFFISMSATYAYFTASAKDQVGSINTGSIKIGLTNTQGKIHSSAITQSTRILPGKTLTVEGEVENVGTSDCYAILELQVLVTKPGSTSSETKLNKIYSFSNETLTEVVENGSTYTANAFVVQAPNENKTNTYKKSFSIPYTFDVYTYSNAYKNANVDFVITAYAIQYSNITTADTATDLLVQEFVFNNKYQAVEYIESSGTQFINTNYIASNKTRIVMDFQLTKLEANILFGSRNTSTSNSFYFNMGGATYNPDFVTSFGSNTVYTIKKADLLRHTVDKNKNEIYLDNSLVHTFEDETFSTPGPMFLFAGYSANQTNPEGYLPTCARIYSCSIYDNDLLVHKYVPCYRTSDNEIGLYDMVSKSFLTNSGSGEFTKGTNI